MMKSIDLFAPGHALLTLPMDSLFLKQPQLTFTAQLNPNDITFIQTGFDPLIQT